MSYDKQAYNEQVLTNIYRAIFEFQNSIDESVQDKDQALAEVILNATNYPSIVAGHISDLIEESRKEIEL